MRDAMSTPVLLATLSLLVPAANVQADDLPTLEITEWQVPWDNARPRDPYRGPDGRVWFVGQTDDYVATLDPDTGEFHRIELVEGAGPHTVTVNEAGAWYAGNRVAHIGRIDPETDAIEVIPMPGEDLRDPHTMVFSPEGNIWFTAQHSNQIGFLDAGMRAVKTYDVATPRARPYGLELDGEGRPWAVLFGTNRLATIDPASGKLREIELPREEARPRRIAVTDDGMVWYVDFLEGYLGRYNPVTGAIDEWQTPGGPGAGLYAMGADAQGRLWMVETGPQPNRFIGFDPRNQKFTRPFEIASGGGVVRHMSFDLVDNAFWFGTDVNTIGRAVVR
jgi:virginiamycin B lyase